MSSERRVNDGFVEVMSLESVDLPAPEMPHVIRTTGRGSDCVRSSRGSRDGGIVLVAMIYSTSLQLSMFAQRFPTTHDSQMR